MGNIPKKITSSARAHQPTFQSLSPSPLSFSPSRSLFRPLSLFLSLSLSPSSSRSLLSRLPRVRGDLPLIRIFDRSTSGGRPRRGSKPATRSLRVALNWVARLIGLRLKCRVRRGRAAQRSMEERRPLRSGSETGATASTSLARLTTEDLQKGKLDPIVVQVTAEPACAHGRVSALLLSRARSLLLLRATAPSRTCQPFPLPSDSPPTPL